jgi:ubiquinone/menaquinone biosynthesis C-methylase UbiE
MDLAEYRRASHAVWESMAAGWDAHHAYVEEVTRPVTDLMLDRARPAPGETVLELAAGTGIVGLAVAATLGGSGQVILSDFSRRMVEAARRRGKALGLGNVDYRVLGAERLDLPDGSVDAVLCRFGYMLMADPAAALAETRRVLRRGGRLACAVVGSAEDNPWSSIFARVFVEAGHVAPPAPGAPGIHALADPARLEALITAAGFERVHIEEVHTVWAFTGLDQYWEFIEGMAGPISTVLSGLDPEERRRLREVIAERVAPYATADGLSLPAVSLVASATAP